MFRYDKYVWYYEYNKSADRDIDNKCLNKYKVIRLEATRDDDFKIIQELEQNFYEYKKSNEKKRNFTIAFTDSQNNYKKYDIKFCSNTKGNIGTIAFSQTNTNFICRTLFRYPNYEQSKFEKEGCLINVLGLKIIKCGYTDPYEDKRPVPVNRSLNVRLNNKLNSIGVGVVRIKSFEVLFALYYSSRYKICAPDKQRTPTKNDLPKKMVDLIKNFENLIKLVNLYSIIFF